jgi:3-phenylpropionate/cinnamic acid dioxygenase small subunit
MTAGTEAPDTATAAGEAIGLQEAIALIWREADLLDRHDYKAWLGLWSEAGRYIVPVGRDDGGYETKLNIVFDDRPMREARVKRILSGFAMSTAPAARTVRTVSRFVVVDSPTGTIALRCAQHIAEYKFERSRLLAADVSYRLSRKDSELTIDEKVVRLINSDDALFGIGYLL